MWRNNKHHRTRGITIVVSIVVVTISFIRTCSSRTYSVCAKSNRRSLKEFGNTRGRIKRSKGSPEYKYIQKITRLIYLVRFSNEV